MFSSTVVREVVARLGQIDGAMGAVGGTVT
jgi:hypothetical protein